MVNRHGNLPLELIENHISTYDDFKSLFINLGIKKGMLVMLQSNIEQLGYVSGGTQVILDALMDVVGYEGTIVVPSFTTYCKDPANMEAFILNRERWNDIRNSMDAFDRKKSRCNDDDGLANQFMRNDGVIRSYHPLYSFLAWGKYAKIICEKHPLHFGLSKDSPLGKLYELNGFILSLGLDYKDVKIFHLAQYQAEILPIHMNVCPIVSSNNNALSFKKLLDLEFNDEEFNEVGSVMEERNVVKLEFIANSACRFFSAREAVTLATAYFNLDI